MDVEAVLRTAEPDKAAVKSHPYQAWNRNKKKIKQTLENLCVSAWSKANRSANE
jgi:hypothetical protein